MPSESYEAGDKVEYRPYGDGSQAMGIIMKINQAEDGASRYTIRNDDNGMTAEYQEGNVIRKA